MRPWRLMENVFERLKRFTKSRGLRSLTARQKDPQPEKKQFWQRKIIWESKENGFQHIFQKQET